MANEENQGNQILNIIVGGIVSILIAGSAPWWWNTIFSEDNPTSINQDGISKMSGIWDVKSSVKQRIHQDGFIYDAEGEFVEYVIQFDMDSSVLSGKLVGARSPASINPCNQATILGELVKRKVSYVITYTGSCCYNEKMTFKGSVSRDYKTLSGKFDPTSNCRLAFADVRGTKRLN